MSDLPVSLRHRRLRVWQWLLVALICLVTISLVGGWYWLNDDSDIAAIQAEAQAAGIDIRMAPKKPTDPVRLVRAKDVDVAITKINVAGPGRHFITRRFPPLSSEFRAFHQQIPAREVCEVARGIIALGGEPIVDDRVSPRAWSRLLNNRLLIAEGEEFDLCLAANCTRIDMLLGNDRFIWDWMEVDEFSRLLLYCYKRRSSQMRPLADWLDAKAAWLLADYPHRTHRNLLQNFQNLRNGEQVMRMHGSRLPGWLHNGPAIEVAMRMERASILRAELSWHRFVTAHRDQPRLWMDEADRREALIIGAGSWLGIDAHQEVLFLQHPSVVRRLVGVVLYARLLASELRGVPWPVDLCDRAGDPLRRWEKDGHLIGAYSVGPDGLDDGGDSRKDLLFRLRLDPPEPLSTP